MSDVSDPYLYAGTNVLKNVPGLRDQEQLAAFETVNTAARIYELLQDPLPGSFDAAHLKAIHRHIFQDVYPWAGQFRTTMLGKTEHLGRPTRWFTPPHLLEHEAERIFDALHRANLLRGLAHIDFASEAARLLGEINLLHPFREGNGRSQRILLGAVAREAGYELYFDVISRGRMVQASIEANDGNLGTMRRMFEEITDITRIRPLRRAIAFLSSQNFDWNETYVATTTPGQAYAGTLAGRDGEAFMMRSDDNQILIGRYADIAPEIRNGERLSFRAGKA